MGFSNDDNQSQVTSPSREAKKAQQETSALTDDLPSNIPSPDLVDALVNSEMCKLSLGEREQVTEDIHGVAEEIKETPEIVSQAQSDLDAELQKLKGKEAYDLALKMNPEYVTNKSFRLRFLRSTLFDAKAAADKMSRHFRMKLDLFGKDKLTKDITQDDLEKEELELLHSGFQRFLPVRDAAGRGVAVWLAQLAPDVGGTPDQVLRWKVSVPLVSSIIVIIWCSLSCVAEAFVLRPYGLYRRRRYPEKGICYSDLPRNSEKENINS